MLAQLIADPTLAKYLSVGDVIVIIALVSWVLYNRRSLMKRSDCIFVHQHLTKEIQKVFKESLDEQTTHLREYLDERIENKILKGQVNMLTELKKEGSKRKEE